VPYETITYRRAELYDEVWAEPVEIVAKRYEISGVALAKVCRKLRVPLPGRGYWARKRAGQKIKRPPLPPLKEGAREDHSVSRWRAPERPKPVVSPATEAIIAREQAAEAAIAVPATLDQPHKLVAMSAKLLQRAKAINGVVRCHDRRCLDITVSPAALDRALRIVDAVLRALGDRGVRVEVTDVRPDDPRRGGYYHERKDEVPSNVTRVQVGGEWIRFAVTEKVAHQRPPPPPAPKHLRGIDADWWQRTHRPPTEYVPTGQLTLAILNIAHLRVPASWRDGKRQRVEDCLNAFVASLYLVADAIKAHRVQQERWRQEAEEEQTRQWEERRRREEEAKRAKQLEEAIAQWRLVRDVRAYVAEARQMVADAKLTITPDGPLDEWLKFASSYADKVDPLANLRADIAEILAENAKKGISTGARGRRCGDERGAAASVTDTSVTTTPACPSSPTATPRRTPLDRNAWIAGGQ
jgi:hypothetical protein